MLKFSFNYQRSLPNQPGTSASTPGIGEPSASSTTGISSVMLGRTGLGNPVMLELYTNFTQHYALGNYKRYTTKEFQSQSN